MRYQVVYTPRAVADLKGLDRPARALVYGWITKNLVDCPDPRFIGDGDPEGGRWRYCIGEYRLIAEIEEERIVILAVSTGLGLGRSWQGLHSGPNLFLKSTLRQPVKTALLLAVMALITFAFVSRGAEYLLVKQETERLGSFYRSIGTVESLGGTVQLDSVMEYLQESPYVKTADQALYGSAVMSGTYNAEHDSIDAGRYLREDTFFYGTLEQVSVGSFPDGAGGQVPSYRFSFKVDDVLAGYPEAIQAGDSIVLINSIQHHYLGKMACDLTSIYEEMEVGHRYLIRGEYACYNPISHLRDSDGCGVYVFRQLTPDGPWFFPVEAGQKADLSDPRLAGLEQQLRIFDDNQHAVPAIVSMDVSVLASAMQNWSPYLLEGRWPDREDHDAGRRVCAIPEKLAIVRGLEVGGTLTMTLRDLSYHYGFLCTSEDLARIDDIAYSETEAYEIIGIYNTMPYNDCGFVFIPSSARPDIFGFGKRPNPEDVVFKLTSPAVEAQFMVEAAEDLGAWGVQPIMRENNWANFQAVAGPMQKSALSILLAAVFTVGLAAIRLSIVSSEKKVTNLYDTTVVEFDITKDEKNAILHPRYNAKNDGFITVKVVEAIRETGFIQDAFLAGGNTAVVFPYEGEWSVGQPVPVGDASPTRLAVRSFDDLAEYIERSRDRLSITYLGNWDDNLFSVDWSEFADDNQKLFPVVLPMYLYDAYGFQPGDTIGVSFGGSRLCAVAGYYSGLVDGLNAPLLMPNSAVETMAGDQMLYAGATFFLDPARNRELSQFRTALDGIIDKTKSKLTLRAVVRDNELRQAVEPLEDSIVLMKLLYPVVLSLSLLVAAGIAVLFVMTSAKEAAIMRVLGTSRLRSRVMLALQTAFTSAAGLLLGLAGVLAYTGRTRPELLAGLVGASALCAMLYLLAAIIGAAASSTVVHRKIRWNCCTCGNRRKRS